MQPIRRIENLIEPALLDMGFSVVRVRISGGARPILQIMVDRNDEAGINVDDCAAVSHAVSAILDVEDPISGTYTLEVSSPGIDRPLVRPRDFERFQGFEAKIEMQSTIDGKRRFRGRLDGLLDGSVRLATKDGEITLPFENIEQAKLILTDDLLAAANATG